MYAAQFRSDLGLSAYFSAMILNKLGLACLNQSVQRADPACLTTDGIGPS